MKSKLFTIAALAALTAFTFGACKDDNDEEPVNTGNGTLEIEFDNVAGGQDLQLDKAEYTNSAGDTFKVTMLNYYISNFILEKEDGSQYVVPQDESYFLIKESDPGSHLITLNDIPAGDYTKIHFTIGVDSLRSTMDISERQGVLNPDVNSDMYWSWNSGYIFVKLEGTSTASTTTPNSNGDKIFQWHIGGFGPSINNIRQTSVEVHHGDEPAHIGEGKDPHAHIFVDVLKAFDGPQALKIADYSIIHFNALSVDISNNYQDMFELDHIHQ